MAFETGTINLPEPACEPPFGYYFEVADDSTQCSECGVIAADEANSELGIELGTCRSEGCQYAAVIKLRSELAGIARRAA